MVRLGQGQFRLDRQMSHGFFAALRMTARMRTKKRSAWSAPFLFARYLLRALVVMSAMVVVMVARGEGRSGHGDQKHEEGEGGLRHGSIVTAAVLRRKLLRMHVRLNTGHSGADRRRVLLR